MAKDGQKHILKDCLWRRKRVWCEQLYIVPKSKECLGEILLLEAAAAAKSLQSCPTLCDPIDGSPPGSPVPGILQQEHWSGLLLLEAR